MFKPRQQRVSRVSVIAILVTLLVLVIIGVVVGGTMAVLSVRRSTHPKYATLTHQAKGTLEILVPVERVSLATIPKPMKRVAISNHPIVDRLDGFLTTAEAAWVLNLAAGRYRPSTTMADAAPAVNSDRTSQSVFLTRPQDLADATLQKIMAAAVSVTNLPRSYMEPLQVVRYVAGQYYKSHYDYLEEVSEEVKAHGQRTLTILVYLNDLPAEEAGGGTKFHALNFTVKPTRGTAVLWHNVTPDGRGDPRTLHSGEPLLSSASEKYAMNIWFRDRPQATE
jgi:prolyl 4-hydroxylase